VNEFELDCLATQTELKQKIVFAEISPFYRNSKYILKFTPSPASPQLS